MVESYPKKLKESLLPQNIDGVIRHILGKSDHRFWTESTSDAETNGVAERSNSMTGNPLKNNLASLLHITDP